MARYSQERRAAVLAKLAPPESMNISSLAKETGISEQTLYNWRQKVREKGCAMPGDIKNPEKWSSTDKFAVVIESSNLNEAELSEYCRKKGLYSEQISQWKQACMKANATQAELNRTERERSKGDKRKIKILERELNRKDKALAETAALLVLQKKAQALWGEPEGD